MSFPFHGKEFIFTQPDGSKITVKGWGDQHHAVFETVDGFTITKDPVSGFYHYATLSDDGNNLRSTGVRVGTIPAATLRLAPHVRINPEAAKQKARLAYQRMESQRRCEIRRERYKARLRAAMSPSSPLAAPPKRKIEGDYVGLCLLIQFPDVPGTIPQQEVSDFCNEKGYSGFGNHGSVFDYFYDNSKGKLRYTNVVTPYYTAKNPRAYYTNPQVEQPLRAYELIKEALTDLKAKGFDFNQLSSDDEGYIYAMNVFYAGVCPNNWAEGLWPHSWHLDIPTQMSPGRLAYDYQITDMGRELSLATFCHENGHMVCDCPDLYDYGYESRGVGDYCLMASGGREEKNPCCIGAYLKNSLGWGTKVTPITDGMQAELTAGENEFCIYRKNQAEYFILENRYKDGRDQALPDSGLAIWHVDELASNDNEQMTAGQHYECALEQADGQYHLEHNSNSGDSNDLYHAPNSSQFRGATKPNSSWWDGTPSRLAIFSISEPGRVIRFSVKYEEIDIKHYRASSSPAVDIPDNSSAGVRDTVKFAESALISSVTVNVDITHPYRGDLRVYLISPSGTSVVLHDRNGGRDDDIKAKFDISSTPGLAQLIGLPLQGDWTLQVQDLAPSDQGRLNHWDLDILAAGEDKPDTIVELKDSPGINIPDNNPTGIERSLTVEASGQVKEVEVSLDITHTYIGDLLVTLVSPKGSSIDLHHRMGGGADNIIKTYTSATTPGLISLQNESIQGAWKLKVADLAGKDLGKLNTWILKIIRM